MTTPGMRGEVSPESMGKTAFSAAEGSSDAKPGHFRNYWEHCGTKSVKALHSKAVRAIEEGGIQSQKGNPGSMIALKRAGEYACRS
jgi:hypothetical protein